MEWILINNFPRTEDGEFDLDEESVVDGEFDSDEMSVVDGEVDLSVEALYMKIDWIKMVSS